MVRQKPKSKRVTVRQRHKIERKVKDHHRKQRKLAKKDPTWRSKLKKDPGVPNLFPFKEQILAERAERSKALQEAKEEKKRLRDEALASGMSFVEAEKSVEDQLNSRSLPVGIEEMARAAADAEVNWEEEEAGDEDETDGIHTARQVTSDSSLRAYAGTLKNVIESASVIIHVLDARDPLGTRSRQVESLVEKASKASNPPKRIVLLLNKIDLIPKPAVTKWLAYLRQEYPTLAFKSATNEQRRNLGQKALSDADSTGRANSGESLGAQALITMLKSIAKRESFASSSSKRTGSGNKLPGESAKYGLTVGVVGMPNVGKSSLINSLKRSRVCQTGATPGLTKGIQEIVLEGGIRIIDSPGVVHERTAKGASQDPESILRNAVKIELVEDPIAPVDIIVKRSNREQLMMAYNIPAFLSTTEFLIGVAKSRGRIKKGGVPDLRAAAQAVLRDWNEGKISYFTMPPSDINPAARPKPAASSLGTVTDADLGSARIISGDMTAPEFDIDALLAQADSDVLSSHGREKAPASIQMNSSLYPSEVDVDLDGEVVMSDT